MILCSFTYLSNVTKTTQAQTQTRFICGDWQGTPTTIAQTATGEVPVIKWVSDYFSNSGYTPERRCQEVSLRFQNYHENGMLKFLTTGRLNSQPVVCITESNTGACQGLLFTLKPESNPNQTLVELMGVRVNKSSALNETTGRVYINMETYIQESTEILKTDPLW